MNSGAGRMPRDHVIRCGAAAGEAPDQGDLVLDIDGTTHAASLRIDRLAARLVANLPDRVVDLLEVAGYIYAADAALRRGGPVGRGMGADWRRHLRFEVPVRDPELWGSERVCRTLTDTLGFLSDDFYEFSFVSYRSPPARDRYFRFRTSEGFEADEALLFSGGLDSLAGALEELLGRHNRAILVSHHSSNTIRHVQSHLVGELRKHVGANRLLHVPVKMQMRGGSNREPTHRARSFFFAAIGIATASMFGLDRLRFYENGVVSLNLPPASQVVGARATRSTHPQALDGFGWLFSAIFDRPVRVDNPSIWKTKTEIVETIRDLGAVDMIRATRSCGEVRDMTITHPHCGLCSQCIDRRFAAIAADVAGADPVEAYAVDPLSGPRHEDRHREIALGYVRNARRYAAMTPADFIREFGEIQRAVGYLRESAGAAAERLFGLHKRHGAAVVRVMADAIEQVSVPGPGSDPRFDRESLVMLAGRDLFAAQEVARRTASASTLERSEAALLEPHRSLILGPGSSRVTLEGLGVFGGVAARVLRDLAYPFLEASGAGHAHEDYPLLHAQDLVDRWGIGEEAVRRRISRLRRDIRASAIAKGLDTPADDSIVETLAGRGYRLNPDRVKVIVPDIAKQPRMSRDLR